MSVIDSTSKAAAVGVGAKIVPFGTTGGNVIMKVNQIATYDPLKTSVVDEVAVQIFSAADSGDKFGFGWPLHRLAIAHFKGSNGAGELWQTPQSEVGTASDGEIAWTGTTTSAGSIYLRIANELYNIAIPTAATIEIISDAVVAFVNAVADTPVVAAKTATTFETTFTSKAKGLEQDNISITLNADTDAGETLPAGISGAVITDMTNGAGTPDIQDALDGMGTGDDANQNNFSFVGHGYGLVTAELDKIGLYVGLGNGFTGCYSKLVNRPFRSINVDIDPGSSALTALLVITDARLSDRANTIIGMPDEDEIPTELAAEATGIIARMAQAVPGENYTGQSLQGVGKRSTSANRWTKNYSERDTAVKSGVSPTRVIAGQLYLQNVITFFRPANIPEDSNGYRSVVAFAVEKNITNDLEATFESESWQGISIVSDSSLVTDFDAQKKTRDVNDVIAEVNNRATFHEGMGWVYSASFVQKNSTVALRSGGTGFDTNYKHQLPGEAQIYNIQSSFDTNIS